MLHTWWQKEQGMQGTQKIGQGRQRQEQEQEEAAGLLGPAAIQLWLGPRTRFQLPGRAPPQAEMR